MRRVQCTVVNDKEFRFPDDSHAVHLWNEMWRRAGFAKDDRYDPAYLYERMLTASGEGGPTAINEGAKPARDTCDVV